VGLGSVIKLLGETMTEIGRSEAAQIEYQSAVVVVVVVD
jgi:phosphate/sulfate permease